MLGRILLCLLLLCGDIKAQIEGSIIDAGGNGIPYATMIWLKQKTGTLSDSTGHFHLEPSMHPNDSLEISAMGFRTQYLSNKQSEDLSRIVLQPDENLLNTLVVSADRAPMLLKNAAVSISVINKAVLEQTQSVSLADGLRFSPGLRIENNCQNCGFTGVRLNGLPAAYTQILINSRPVYSAMAAVYGLEQIPPAMIEQIEVVQGGGSVLFGGNAIAGTVNIITTQPKNRSWEAGIQHSRIGADAPDTYAYLSGSWLNKKRNTGVQGFSAYRTRKPWDMHGDGLTEITQLQSHTSGLQFFHEPSSRAKIQGSARFIRDQRRGGSELHLRPHQSQIAEWISHSILGADLNYSLQSRNERRTLALYSAFQRVNRDSYYGGSLHPDPLSQYGFSADYSGVAGIQVSQQLLRWNGRLLFGNETVAQGIQDRFSGQMREIQQTSISSGTYIQYAFQPASKTFITTGLRLDAQHINGQFKFSDTTLHNQHLLWVPNARLTIRQKLRENLNVRYQLSTGFRGPQVFDEDLHIDLAGSNLRFIRMAGNLKTERSVSQSLGLEREGSWKAWQSRMSINGFFTQLINPFVIEGPVAQTANLLLMEKRNGAGARVHGMSAELRMQKGNHSIQAGITAQQARYVNPEIIFEDNLNTLSTRNLLRTPAVYGYATASFDLSRSWYAALSCVYTGSMQVAHMTNTQTGFTTLKTTPDFWDAGLRLMKSLALNNRMNLELEAGVNNLFNRFQADLDTGVLRDAGYVYGPMRPRTFTLGLRLKWKE